MGPRSFLLLGSTVACAAALASFGLTSGNVDRIEDPTVDRQSVETGGEVRPQQAFLASVELRREEALAAAPAAPLSEVSEAAPRIRIPIRELHGQVMDPEGWPLSGVELRLAKDDPASVRTTSSASGTFDSEAPASYDWFVAESHGLTTVASTPLGGENRLEVVAAPAVRGTVEVVDAETREAAVAVQVTVRLASEEQERLVELIQARRAQEDLVPVASAAPAPRLLFERPRLSTDRKGRVFWERLPAGVSLELSFRRPGYAPTVVTWEPGLVPDLEVTLDAVPVDAPIHGVVLGVDGEPLRYATVVLGPYKTLTGAEGRFAIRADSALPGDLSVHHRDHGFVVQRFTESPSGTLTLTLPGAETRPTATLRAETGEVVPQARLLPLDAEGLPQIRVPAWLSAVSDAKGKVEVPPARVGVDYVAVSKAGRVLGRVWLGQGGSGTLVVEGLVGAPAAQDSETKRRVRRERKSKR